MREYTRAQRIVRNRKIMLFILILATVIFAGILFTNRASAENSREVYTYYTSYEIQPGDSLWTIADHFAGPDFTTKEDFISNTKQLNHMLDDEIIAGNYLVIKYSSYEKL